MLEAQLERLRTVLPEEQDVADLLRRVQAMATQSNLTIRGFTPQTVTRRELHAEWPIGLKLEGTYHDLGAFLERVSKFPRIINVGALHITARENQTAAHDGDRRVHGDDVRAGRRTRRGHRQGHGQGPRARPPRASDGARACTAAASAE